MTMVRFIAGSGRSGTTWVLDALAKANRLRPVFEPLNPWASSIGFRYAHRALLPEDAQEELQEYLAAVFAGKRNRLWTQFRQQRQWIIPWEARFESPPDVTRFGRRTVRFVREAAGLASMSFRNEPIVKCIWANLMLGWLVTRMECRIVLIIRHPGAVIESEMRGGWKADDALKRFRDDARFHDVTGGRYVNLLERRLTYEESLALRWLIENQRFMEDVRQDAISVIHYEHLKANATGSWASLCAYLGLPRRPDPALLAQPSQQSSDRAKTNPAGTVESPWLAALGPERCSRVQALLDEARFVAYDMSEPQPRPGSASDRVAASGAQA
jgi:hypothetical protein